MFDHVDIKDMDFMMQNCDKDIFARLLDKHITVDQLSQRVVERRFGIRYKTIDDVNLTLVNMRCDPEHDELRKLVYSDDEQTKSAELDFRCRRSIAKRPGKQPSRKSFFFRTAPRTKDQVVSESDHKLREQQLECMRLKQEKKSALRDSFLKERAQGASAI